jgi:hypothetical protein
VKWIATMRPKLTPGSKIEQTTSQKMFLLFGLGRDFEISLTRSKAGCSCAIALRGTLVILIVRNEEGSH